MSLHKIFLCDEMIKLREMLDEKGISWTDRSTVVSDDDLQRLKRIEIQECFIDTSIYRTVFHYNGVRCSVVNGYGTYGGYSPFKGTNAGKLELMFGDEVLCEAFTAEGIFEYIECHSLAGGCR